MKITTNNVEGNLQTAFEGSFTFDDNEAFKTIIDAVDEGAAKQVTIDVSMVDQIDSSALGMLMVLRKKAEEKGVSLTIKKPVGQIEKMFRLSKFYELFRIVE